ncbi:protein O-glucosyltransferase 1 [Oryza brachyantha]|uniref:protein O-glucosyltransferase 1 n=1 Tax=Oryza brachyantha TaxID=4533 RepID=UPI001ADA9E65|nr:protein O-glucosyltransferase 1 [Oryza brachyantha]
MAGHTPEPVGAGGGGGGRARARNPPLSSLVVSTIAAFSAVVVFAIVRSAYDDAVSRTTTLLGHNLEPTPWHPFPHDKGRAPARAAFRCAPSLTCLPPLAQPEPRPQPGANASAPRQCPAYFAAIRRDLAPWRRRGGVTRALLDAARRRASMRVAITGGGRRLHVELYYACVQSRALFTAWSLLQLMRRYPGRVPDVELMFDCMDRPAINRTEHGGDGDPGAPPLFRYCTTRDHFDIPFPDWSFWGWPETNIEPWSNEFMSIKQGAKATKWQDRVATAYWKGNPDVASPLRVALLGCNDTNLWHAEIMRQNWDEEAKSGYQNSKLSSQCTHRYKIYAEGFAWSVSLKYILSCGSMALIIDPQYEDFFSRGLRPEVNFWPVRGAGAGMCESIRDAVEWGQAHPAEAEAVGRRGQRLMQELDMAAVYDYMLHLLSEYARLMRFRPEEAPPAPAQEVCEASVLCLADEKQRRFLEASAARPAASEPCVMPPDAGE